MTKKVTKKKPVKIKSFEQKVKDLAKEYKIETMVFGFTHASGVSVEFKAGNIASLVGVGAIIQKDLNDYLSTCKK